MGLIAGLLTLPLAPVKGVVWVAEQLHERAWEENFSEQAVRRQLVAAQRDLESGRLTEEQYDAIEDELVDRLMSLRRPTQSPGV